MSPVGAGSTGRVARDCSSVVFLLVSLFVCLFFVFSRQGFSVVALAVLELAQLSSASLAGLKLTEVQ